MSASTPSVPLSEDGLACPYSMRAIFNEGFARCRQKRARYQQERLKITQPEPAAAARLGAGVLSITTRYRSDNGTLMAETHHYRRGNRILASGFEDPKLLRVNREYVEPSHGDGEWCADCAEWRPRAEASKHLPG